MVNQSFYEVDYEVFKFFYGVKIIGSVGVYGMDGKGDGGWCGEYEFQFMGDLDNEEFVERCYVEQFYKGVNQGDSEDGINVIYG